MDDVRRYDDWPIRLDEVVKEKEQVPFKWGTHDCCLFAADVVATITGIDAAERFRGKYKTEKGAYRILKKLTGYTELDKALREVMAWYDFKPKAPMKAQRGDFVVIYTELGPTLAVVGPSGLIVAAGPEGVVRTYLTEAKLAWGTI